MVSYTGTGLPPTDSISLSLPIGHHLQLTYKKYTSVPLFVRASYFGAFSEGWGLYAESLGQELNLFEEDLTQLVGFYSFNLLRAARYMTLHDFISLRVMSAP